MSKPPDSEPPHAISGLDGLLGRRPGSDERPSAPLLVSGDPPIGLHPDEAEALERLRASCGSPSGPPATERLASGPAFSEERQKRLAHLRQKYRSGAEPSPSGSSTSGGWSPTAAASHGGGRRITRKDSLRRATHPSLEPPSTGVELSSLRWSALSLPPGVSAASIVTVFDFWNAKLGQISLHAGEPWPDEERRGAQFCAVDARVSPPEGAVAVFDFWSARFSQLTFHAGDSRTGEERHSLQFYAFERPDPGGLLTPCFEWFNSKLKKLTAHTGDAWPDETRGPHDTLFYVLPLHPPPPEGTRGGAGLEAAAARAPTVVGALPLPTEEEECVEEVEVFENERWSTLRSEWGSNHLMPTDPPRFSFRLGATGHASLADVLCPPHVRWSPGQGWVLDRSPAARGGTDNEGWFYARLFSTFDGQLAAGKTTPSPRRMLARRRRWVRRCVDSEGESFLSVRSPPPSLAVPGEYRRSLSLREVAWRGVLGRDRGEWGGAYFVLLRPGVARLDVRSDGSVAPPEALLLQLSTEPPVERDGQSQGALCAASWRIGADAQILDHGSMEQPCRFGLRSGGDELSFNAPSLQAKEAVMRAVQGAVAQTRRMDLAAGELDAASLAAANRSLARAAEAREAHARAEEGEEAASFGRQRERLVVIVYEAMKLRNADQGRTLYSNDKSDPYVSVTVTPTRGRATTRRTHWVDDTLEPRWLVAPDGSPATPKAEREGSALLGVRLEFAPVISGAALLRVVVRDHNSLTPDEDLGSVSLPLRQIAWQGEREVGRWFTLSSQGAVRLGLIWYYGEATVQRDLANDAATVVRQLRELPREMQAFGEEEAEGADDLVRRGGGAEPPQGEYSLLVYVAEARDVQGRDANGLADCALFLTGLGATERTRCVPSTRNPLFDQTVFFSRKDLDESYLTRHALALSLYDMNTLSRKALLGSYSLDLLRVFYAPNRTLQNAWLGLADPRRPEAGVQGFVRLSLQMVAPGEALRSMADTEEENTGEGAAPSAASGTAAASTALVLMPPSVRQQVFFLVVSLRRAEGLSRESGGAPKACARLSFNGHAVQTLPIHSHSPAWQTEFWLPVVLPTCGNLIRLSLCDGQRLLAAAVLSFEEVEEEQSADCKWLQMYALFKGSGGLAVTHVRAGGAAAASTAAEELDGAPEGTAAPRARRGPPLGIWRGSLLLAMRRARNDALDLRVRPHLRDLPEADIGGEPEVDAYSLRAFLSAGSDCPPGARLAVELTWGGYSWLSAGAKADAGSLVEWHAEMQRVGSRDAKVLLTCVDHPEQLPDVLVYLCLDKRPTSATASLFSAADLADGSSPRSLIRLGFLRLGVVELLSARGRLEPSWELLDGSDAKALGGAPVPSLRLCVGVAPLERSDAAWPEALRQLRSFQLPPPSTKLPLELRLHLFSARKLADAPDTYASLSFMGKASRSVRVLESSRPAWFQTLCVQHFSLEPSAAPDAVVTLHREQAGDAVLGRLRFRIDEAVQLDYESDAQPPLPEPTWHRLAEGGELLLVLELLPMRAADQILPPPPPLRPTTRRAYVQVIVVGLRNLRPHNRPAARKPCLLLSAGKGGRVETRRQTARSNDPSARNPNFNEQILVPVDLADNHLFCPELEVRVLDELFGGLATLCLGVASLPFAHRIPWRSRSSLEPSRRSEVFENQLFHAGAGGWVATLGAPPPWSDALGRATAREEALLRPSWAWQAEWAVEVRASHDAARQAGRGQTDAGGWEYAARFDQPHWSGACKVKAVRRRLWVRTQAMEKRDEPLDRRLREGGMAAALVGLRPAGDAARVSGVASSAELQPSAKGGSSSAKKGGLATTGSAPLADDTPLATAPWLAGRTECEGELDDLFSSDSRPFQRWDVFASESSLVRVASLKGLLRVVRREEDAPLGLPASLGALLTPHRYLVRLYVLKAEHLMPADACGTSDAYLRVRCGQTSLDTRSRRVNQVTDADFYEVFELYACLPGESELQIDVMDADLLDSDDLIGSTTIDLEDRVFNPEWQALPLKPLEWRTLRSNLSNNPQGRLSLWLDVFSADGGAEPIPPQWDIAPPNEQQWELRTIVWGTMDVLPHDTLTSMNDLFATLAYGGDARPQQTDTHWRCRDGLASFNWRASWRVSLSQTRRLAERLTLQLWDRDVLKYNDNVGEVVLPLQTLFARAYRERARVEHLQAAEGEEGLEADLETGPLLSKGRQGGAKAPAPTALSSFQLDPDPTLRPPSERSLRAVLLRLWSEVGPPVEGLCGELHKVWLPVYAPGGSSGKSTAAGWVQISVELVPADVADAHPAGVGRGEPNAMPHLPAPAGRLVLSLNPLANCYNILGPKLCASLGCAACGLVSAGLGVILVIQMVPVLAANIVTDILLGG